MLDTTEDDATLARRVAGAPPGGDADAERELYRRLAPRVRLYGLRHLRDAQAAADLAQDVLLLTFESLRAGKVREPERLASFVLGTCRRLVADQRRTTRRRQGLLDRYAADLAPARHPGPQHAVDTERLADCLNRLPERDRAVVVLSFYAELDAGRIGGELGMAPGTVRVARHRVLARLRDCMNGIPA